MVSKDQLLEFQKEFSEILTHAENGRWLPATIVAVLFSVIIVLVIYIGKDKVKENNKRHSDNEEMLSILVKTQVEQKEILTELRILTKSHDRDIERLKDSA